MAHHGAPQLAKDVLGCRRFPQFFILASPLAPAPRSRHLVDAGPSMLTIPSHRTAHFLRQWRMWLVGPLVHWFLGNGFIWFYYFISIYSKLFFYDLANFMVWSHSGKAHGKGDRLGPLLYFAPCTCLEHQHALSFVVYRGQRPRHLRFGTGYWRKASVRRCRSGRVVVASPDALSTEFSNQTKSNKIYVILYFVI